MIRKLIRKLRIDVYFTGFTDINYKIRLIGSNYYGIDTDFKF